MKRFTLTICVLIAALVAASAASAAPAARDPRVPALQHQVAVLTAGLNHGDRP
jgi:opacity protein-like surface antigen